MLSACIRAVIVIGLIAVVPGMSAVAASDTGIEPLGAPAGPVFSPDQVTLSLDPLYAGFSEPLRVTNAGDGSNRLFVVEKAGLIKVIENGQVLDQPFLDIRDLVESAGFEQGLFSVAFHPQYSQNGRFFIVYTSEPDGNNTLARVEVSGNPNQADRSTLVELLSIPNKYENHNSGDVAFGPDGYLYFSTGDGGGGGDPDKNARNPQSLLGKMLRLDVDSGDSYAIPQDNPYVNDQSYLPEIWAVGLRNPWRYSFDRATGDLYIGDVGQGSWEELNLQPASSTGGEDYGWSIMEGQHCYPPQTETCNQSDLTLPILEYPNSDAGDPSGCSIVAGNVYRGSAYPFMNGIFLFGDWCSGQIFAGYQNASGGWSQATLLHSGVTITSFGEDEAGELYLSAQSTGTIYRLHFVSNEQIPWGDETFQTTWARTDQPVSDLAVSRTWIWGPGPNTFPVTEPYAEALGGSRSVQYFDKSRMEITNPDGDSNSIWYVTNGLLVNEMMSGQLQVGDASFEPRQPAEINVAGDADDPEGITYAMLAGFRDRDPYPDGAAIATVLQPDGTTTNDDALASFGITAGALSPETNHRTASVFWDFMNSGGLVYLDGQLTEDQLFINPYYATGLPVTEAYWTLVRVGGVPKQVLLQCFERRCLTYTPDNDPGWRTEAGNVGLHYFAWRHEG